MSGGSFNYLYCADLTERKHIIAAMRDELHGLGYHDAALLSGEVVSLMDRIDASQRSISDVWHAVEWWRSCDYGPEQVAEAVAKWRAAGPEIPPEKVDIAKRLWELEQEARLLRLQLAERSV